MIIISTPVDIATLHTICEVSGGMVIISGSDTTDDIDYGTMSDDTSWTIDDLCRGRYDFEVPEFDIDWIRAAVNAEEATKRMVLIGRNYCLPIYKNHNRRAVKVNRMMFSASGKLSKRIRRIRK